MGDHQDHQDLQVPQDPVDHQEPQLPHHHVHQIVQHFVSQLVHNTVAQQERRCKSQIQIHVGTRATDLTHRNPSPNDVTTLTFYESAISLIFLRIGLFNWNKSNR